MKLKWAEGFSVSERNLFAFIIRGNLVKTMGNIISVLEKEDLTNENESDLRVYMFHLLENSVRSFLVECNQYFPERGRVGKCDNSRHQRCIDYFKIK